MFAAPIAKLKPKTSSRTTGSLPHASTPVTHQPATGSPAISSTDQALLLQRTIGNQALLRLMSAQRDKERPQKPSSFQAPLLSIPIQAKFKVGAVNDPLEREADRVADWIMQAPVPDPVSDPSKSEAQTLQRRPATVSDPAAGAQANPVSHLIGSFGQPLEASVRTHFESRFGRNLGGVRIHRNATAEASADSLNARAYTVGRDIVFAPGMYRPGSSEGHRLLAHELAHVAQQEGRTPVVQRQPKSPTDATTEPAESLDDALAKEERWDKIRESYRELEKQLEPIFEKLTEEQEAQDPFFVKENPNLIKLKAQLQQEKRQLPGEVSSAEKDLTKAEKEFLKADDQLAELENEQNSLAKERESFEKSVPLLASVVELFENGVKERKDAAAKDAKEKLAAVETIKQYIAEKKAYISAKERYLQEMREQLKLQGLSAARRAGVSTETPVSGENAALLQTTTLLQTMIEASRLLAPYVSEKRNTTLRIPGKFKVDDASAFENAKRAANIGPAERGSDVGGFYDRQHDTIHLPQSAHFGEALHEAIHKYSMPVIRNICHNLNEGITQYIADAVLQEQGLPKVERVTYQDKVDCATKLIREFGFDAVAQLYFLGHHAPNLLAAVVRCDRYC
jgi:hypothetical protein